jgi:hypothetical protein
VAGFLADLRLEGPQRVLGSLALELAEALEEAPGYSKARLARELRGLVSELHRAESERRRDEETEVRLANKRAEHEAGVRRQKALLAELGVPDVTPEELRAGCSPDIREEPSLSG